jgi:hypothetical protein
MKTTRARAWALFGAVALVAACGGGGGDGGTASPVPPTSPPPSSPPPASPPPAAPEEFLVAGVSRADPLIQVVVADPAQPLPLVLTATADSVLEVSNVSFDASLRRAAWGHSTAVYYVNNRQVHQINLRKSHGTRTQRISSLASACSIDNWYPFSYATGDDGWVEVTEAGPDAICTTTDDNRKAFIRNSSPSTSHPTLLPAGVSLSMALPDPANNTLVGFIASDMRTTPAKFVMYSRELAYVGDVSGGAGPWGLEFMSFVPGAQLGSSAYVRLDTSIRRLDWSSSGVPVLSPTGQRLNVPANEKPAYFSDASAMYFVDALAIKRMDAAGTVTTLGTLDAAEGPVARLKGLTSEHVVIEQDSASGRQAFTLSKQGGTPLRLAPASWVASVVGLNGDEVIYATKPGYAITAVFRRIRADGSNQRDIAFGSYLQESSLLPVYNPTIPYLSAPTLDAVVWCERPMSQSACPGDGAINSYDVRSGTITTLGRLSLGRGGLVLRGAAFSGRASVINVLAGFTTEFHLLQPGTANSLVRLTINIP